MKKKCPRCGVSFDCTPENILECQCREAKLDQNQRDYLKLHYTSCLCIRCLLEIKSRFYTTNLYLEVENQSNNQKE